MIVTRRGDRDEQHLSLAGELDLASVDLLYEAVERALAQRPRRLVLDLADVTFCDSTGVGALVDACRAARQRQAGFRAVHAHGTTHTAMRVTGVLDLLTAPQ